jgi:hypothetical protein
MGNVRIVPPAQSGSYYFNYKNTHNIVLMPFANANCEFIYCDIGTNNRVSDGGVISSTTFFERQMVASEFPHREKFQTVINFRINRLLDFVHRPVF